MKGRTCLVTGASGGIGQAAARELARRGAKVVLACRSAQRGEAARRAITEATGNPDVELMVVDLSHQAPVRECAQVALRRHPVLHVLVNNAGVWRERRGETADGIETTWATNVLGPFLLTEFLRPALRAADGARVINVASQYAGGLDLADVEFRRRSYSGREAYAQSKQANRLWTWALARRLEGTAVTANAVHPGFVATGLFGKAGGLTGLVASLYARARALTPEQGADTVVWLAASPEAAGQSGRFWIERKQRRCRFTDPGGEEALWTLCEAMTQGGRA